MSGLLLAEDGVVRDGAAWIRIRGAVDVPATLNVRIMRDDAVLATFDRIWPSDFERAEGHGADATGVVRIADLGRWSPLTAVDVLCGGTSVATGPDWRLEGLYATSEAAFESLYVRSKHRVRDTETLMFATGQLTRHYRLRPSHRVVATVLYAYRALDSTDPDICDEATAALEALLADAEALQDTRHVRSDRLHLIVSMRCVLWHLHLFRGRHEAFEAELDAIAAILRSGEPILPGMILNGCLSMFLLAYVRMRAGRIEEARALAEDNARLYVRLLNRLPITATAFREAYRPHVCVSLGLDMIAGLKRSRPLIPPTEALDAAQRIRKSPALPALHARFAEHVGG